MGESNCVLSFLNNAKDLHGKDLNIHFRLGRCVKRTTTSFEKCYTESDNLILKGKGGYKISIKISEIKTAELINDVETELSVHLCGEDWEIYFDFY